MQIINQLHTIALDVTTFFTVAVITPLTYTAYHGQPAVIFHCSTANATEIFWRINGTTRGSDYLAARGIKTIINQTILQSNLTISSTVANNNTSILCRAGREEGLQYKVAASNEATFYVQGQLVIIVVCKLWMSRLTCPALQVHWESVQVSKLTHLETTTSV